jgi:predicted RNA binding protein YcfA (HicA-like mRNA interferase family)/predicted RNase H-like HicB family nuclease
VADVKVREVIRLVEADGWKLVRTRGSHRHYHHAEKGGIVTVAGHPSDDLDPKTQASILKRSGVEEMIRYAVLYAPTATGYSAHVPDLPGCIAAARTLEETRELMKEAIEGHLECMREFGYPIPEPTTLAEEVEVPLAS